jgi:hypothetical protein
MWAWQVKQLILIAKFLLNADWTKFGGKLFRVLFIYGLEFFQNLFTVLRSLQLCMAERKFTRLFAKSRAGDWI